VEIWRPGQGLYEAKALSDKLWMKVCEEGSMDDQPKNQEHWSVQGAETLTGLLRQLKNFIIRQTANIWEHKKK
jgi:hypothetical protein